MVKKKSRPIGFWERTLTAIAITFLVLGYYRMLSKAHAAPYELFHQEVFDRELDELFKLKETDILKM